MTQNLHTSSSHAATSADVQSNTQQPSAPQVSTPEETLPPPHAAASAIFAERRQGQGVSHHDMSSEDHSAASVGSAAARADDLDSESSSSALSEVTERDSTTYWRPHDQGQNEFGEHSDIFDRRRHIAYGEELLAAYHFEHLNQVLSAPQTTAESHPLSQMDTATAVAHAIAKALSDKDDPNAAAPQSASVVAPEAALEQAAASAKSQAQELAKGINQLQDTLQRMDFSAQRRDDTTGHDPELLRTYNTTLQGSISSLDVPEINSRITALKNAEHKLNATPHLNEQEMQDYSFLLGGRSHIESHIEPRLAKRIQAAHERINHLKAAQEQKSSASTAAPHDLFAASTKTVGGASLAPEGPEAVEAQSSLLQGEIDTIKGLLRGLHNLEHSIHLLMAILGDGLMLHAIGSNYQRKVLWVNQALCKIYGYSYSQIEKLTSTPQNPQIIHPSDIERFFLSFMRCAAHQQQARDLASVFTDIPEDAASSSSSTTTDGAAPQQKPAAAAAAAPAGAEIEAMARADAKIADALTAAATRNSGLAGSGAAAESATLGSHESVDPDAQFVLQDLTTHLQMLQSISSTDNVVHIEYRVLNGESKKYIWIDLRGVYIGQFQGHALFLCLIKEITAEKKTKDRMERWIRKSELLSEACQEMVFEYDFNTDVFERFGNYQDYVPALQRKQEGFLANLPIKDNIHPDDLHILSSLLRDTTLARENKRRTVKFRLCPLGCKEYLWHACSAIGYTEESTGHIKIIGKVYNIHSYETHIASLSIKNQHDPMTHLLNKTAMEQQCRQTLQERKQERHALLMIDIDNFKQVNDTCGHSFGDEVIQMVASCLTNTFRSSDLVARVGGDEFAVLLKHVSFDQAIALSELYLQILRNQGARLSRPYNVTSSVGIAFYPDDASNFIDLYNAADNALYTVKRQHKGTIAQYNSCLVAMPTPVLMPNSVLTQEQERFEKTMQHIDEEHAEAVAQGAVAPPASARSDSTPKG